MRVSLRGVGKYPFVRPSTAVLDFGSVVVGTSAEKAVQLINATPAACDFAVHRQHPDDTDAVFSVNVTSGRLAGDAQMAATVTFTPSAPGAFTREAFVVTTPGGTHTLLTCTGTAVSPGVRCSATAVAFGPVAVGSVTAQRFVQLDNTCGDLAVRYSFDACIGSDGAAVFEFTDGAGVIPPKSFAQIGISFRPGTSAVYHRRVTILLADAPPLGLDLLGTGFTPKARPPDVGLPELLTWRSAASATDVAVAPCYMAAASGDPSCGMQVEVLDASGEVCASHGVIDFGAQQPLRAPPPSRQVRVRNTTRHTLEVFWHKLLAPADGAPTQSSAASQSQSTFIVLPEAADVEPGETATFRVSFRPATGGTVYSTRLEVYSHAKSQRSWRMADPTDTVLPPWGCALTCVGHTYGADATGALLPDVRLMLPGTAFGQAPAAKSAAVPTVAFPPAWARQHSVYRTITLVNSEAGRHVAWAVVPQSQGSPFTVRPAAGVLAPDAHAMLCLAFTPTKDGTCTSTLAFLLNGAPAPVLSCALWGVACTPHLALSTSLLHLRPTCVGTSTLRRLQVRNPTRLPVSAKWVLPLPQEGEAVLTHDQGDGFTLAGRDELDVTWTFAPHTVGPFYALAALHCWPADSPSQAQETARVRIFGDGAPCALRIEPPMVAIGALGVGTTAEVAVTVFNDSEAPLECTWAPAAASPGACTLTPQVATVMRLTAKSSVSALLTLRQGGIGECVSHIQLVVARKAGGVAADAGISATTALEVRSIGEVPRLQVCAASCPGLSPASAWDHLRCDLLNTALAAGDDTQPLYLPVGVAAAGQAPSLVHLWLHNPSLVAAHWAFKLANEPDISPERWAQASLVPVPDQDERLTDDGSAVTVEDRAVSKQLFDLAPRAGVLEPGATVRVAIAYSHEQHGRHVVCAHFKVAASASGSHGAATSPLRLMLTGRTLRDGTIPALHGPGVELHRGHLLRAALPPQPMGMLAPAILSVPLRSAAACDCTYILDTAALEEVTRTALGFPVLRCLNPKGWIPARGATALHFAFRPVVAAPVHAAMPLLLMCATQSADGADGADGVAPAAEVISVELSASGYHPLAPSAAQYAANPAMDAALAMEPPPGVPGQLGALQPAAVAFPPVPPGGRASVQVRVMPPVDAASVTMPPGVRFAWELGEGSLPVGATLSVTPSQGWVTPEGVICTLTLHAPTKPCVLRTALCCTFTPADVAAPKHGAAPASAGLAALRGSRAARVARLEAAVATEEGGGGGGEEAEEVFAQHGARLGRPLARPPRPPRTHVIYAATISSALKRPLALRDALPPAAPAASTLAVAEGVSTAAASDVGILDVWCLVHQPQHTATHDNDTSAAFVDDYVDLDTDFAGEAAEEARDLVSDLQAGSAAAPAGRLSTASVASAYSTAGTVVVDRTLEELLSGQDWDDWDADAADLDNVDGGDEEDIQPEDADAQAVAACDTFLDAVEGLLLDAK